MKKKTSFADTITSDNPLVNRMFEQDTEEYKKFLDDELEKLHKKIKNTPKLLNVFKRLAKK